MAILFLSWSLVQPKLSQPPRSGEIVLMNWSLIFLDELFKFLVSCSDKERNCKHASLCNCIQAHGSASILKSSGTFWNVLESSGTFWNLLEPSGTFWNFLEPFGTFSYLLDPSGTETNSNGKFCWILSHFSMILAILKIFTSVLNFWRGNNCFFTKVPQ